MLPQDYTHTMGLAVIDEGKPGLACLDGRGHCRAIQFHARDAAADAIGILDCDLVARAAVLEHDLEARPASGNARREGERCPPNAKAENCLDARSIQPPRGARVPR